MELTPTSGEQERHNMTVITVGSKYEVYVRSPAPSHMQTFNNPFRTLTNKVRGKILLKKSSCVFLPAFSFLRFYHALFNTASLSCVLHSCVILHESIFLRASVFTIIESVWYGKWVYNKKSGNLLNAIRIYINTVLIEVGENIPIILKELIKSFEKMLFMLTDTTIH